MAENEYGELRKALGELEGEESFTDLVEEYIETRKKLEELVNRIGRVLVENLREVIPDISYSVGWYESGVETLALYADSHSMTVPIEDLGTGRYTPLERIIMGMFPGLIVETPYGIWLDGEEKEKVIEILKRLGGKEIKEE